MNLEVRKLVRDAIDNIHNQRPLNDVIWKESLARLEKTTFSIKRSWEPYKAFSMTPLRRHIRLAHTFPLWENVHYRSSNLLHESAHLAQFDRRPWPFQWASFALSYAQRCGRMAAELEAFRENARWECRRGYLKLSDTFLTRNSGLWVDRVVDHFEKNYWMGERFNERFNERFDMKRKLVEYVVTAIKEEGFHP